MSKTTTKTKPPKRPGYPPIKPRDPVTTTQETITTASYDSGDTTLLQLDAFPPGTTAVELDWYCARVRYLKETPVPDAVRKLNVAQYEKEMAKYIKADAKYQSELAAFKQWGQSQREEQERELYQQLKEKYGD